MNLTQLTMATLTALALTACNSQNATSASATESTTTSVGGSTTVDTAADAALSERDSAAQPATADAAVVEDAAPTVTMNGLRSIAFRAGARPPRGNSPAHGSVAWIVVVAAASQGSAELTAVFEQLTTQRFAASVGEVGCTASAGEPYPATIALGGSAQIVTVSFRTEREARAFAAALSEQPLWVGRARIACAD